MPSLADLIRMGKQYVSDALPGGSLNPEVNRQGILDGAALSTTAVPVLGDLLGLGADINRYATDPESRTAGNFALSGLGMLPFVPAMTAWHGSPHKFDKFSLDKIGTGEGAQTYGHGLYLAESQGVATGYADKLSKVPIDGGYDSIPRMVTYGKTRPRVIDQNAPSNTLSPGETALLYTSMNRNSPFAAAQDIRGMIEANPSDIAHYQAALKLLESGKLKGSKIGNEAGNLYKTDIPDEAVARFLDWDKPLSQQAPEVQAAIGLDKNPNASIKDMTGLEFYVGTGAKLGEPTSASKAAAEHLRKKGISGIRYLDGGSRSAGQGSSNFVAFDPEMIRILERNGQPTGLEPWKPGEYSLKDLIPK